LETANNLGVAGEGIRERGWFTKANIQSFLHYFIGEKAPGEKMQVIVGRNYQAFIEGLEKPMKINEMRNMKEPNYSKLRAILKDPKQYGDPVLRGLALFAEELGLSKNSYDMIYEGFWDLYCRKPAVSDLTTKKLETWINYINLITPPFETTTEAEAMEGDEEEAEGVAENMAVKAICRVRIPLKRREGTEPDVDEANDGE
jgi:hypothetical protein